MAAPPSTRQVQLVTETYLPPGHAPHPVGAVVTLPTAHANELVGVGHAAHVDPLAPAAPPPIASAP